MSLRKNSNFSNIPISRVKSLNFAYFHANSTLSAPNPPSNPRFYNYIPSENPTMHNVYNVPPGVMRNNLPVFMEFTHNGP